MSPTRDRPIDDVVTFLEKILQGRHHDGGCVHRWAASVRPELLDPGHHLIELDGEVLPNPLALATDETLSLGRSVLVLTGPAHGDLHPGNILVPVRNVSVGSTMVLRLSTYWLIDLSRFQVDAPLASDPVHLVLSLAALQLGRLSEPEQDALLHYIVDPDDGSSRALLPGWVQQVVSAIRGAVPEWIERSFAEEWREQTLLSLVAWGLVFAGRRTTDDAQRMWFFRLAAHAARAYLGGTPALGWPLVGPRLDPSVARTGPEPMAPLAGRRARRALPSPSVRTLPLDQEMVRAGDELARRVKQQWAKAAAGRRLIDPRPVRVRWEKALPVRDGGPDPVLRRGDVAVVPRTSLDEPAPPATELFPMYLSLRSGHGRLLIMGEAGSGKSAAAILLALDILDHRAQIDQDADRAEVAVPVILTPHDWDPARQSVTSWLAQRIAADYSLLGSRRRGRKAAEKLIRKRRIALFLDGLDEMPKDALARALQQLEENADLTVVVAGRTAELVDADAHSRLSSALAVELQPVHLAEAADYLVRCHSGTLPSPWRRLVDHVREHPDGPLARALDSPLILGLIRDNYRDAAHADVDELADRTRFPTRAAVERHLLGRVVPAAYAPRPGYSGRSYRDDQAQRWLSYLAHLMEEGNSRDLAWWQLHETLPRWQRTLVTSVATGLFPGLLFALVGVFGSHPVRGFVSGLMLGPVAAAFDALIVARGPRERRTSSGRIALGYLLAAALAGMISGALLMGVRAGIPAGLLAGSMVGGIGGLAAAAEAGRNVGMSGRPTFAADSTLSPAEGWRQSARHAGRFGTLMGLTVGATLGLVAWRAGEPFTRIAGLSALAATVMPFFVVMLSPITKTVLAALQFWVRRRGPVRVVRFLEEARGRNVLRIVGPVYQFRHARLQEVLAESWPPGSRRDGDGSDT